LVNAISMVEQMS